MRQIFPGKCFFYTEIEFYATINSVYIGLSIAITWLCRYQSEEIMTNEYFMTEALKEAAKAFQLGEVPIGAVIVKEGVIIGRGYNKKECLKDATNHAEIIAIKEASATIGGWRLTGCEMYVTIEPCVMCAGALYQTRIDKVYIGAKDPKGGGVDSLYQIFSDERLNHIVECEFGVLEEASKNILQKFFRKLRKR